MFLFFNGLGYVSNFICSQNPHLTFCSPSSAFTSPNTQSLTFTLPSVTFTAGSAAVTEAYIYLLSVVGPCRGPSGYGPCFGGAVNQAEIFNCVSAAASSSGCTQTVANASTPQVSYQITVWYPYATPSKKTNCMYESSGDPAHQYLAYCIMTNSTAFIVAEPGLPPL